MKILFAGEFSKSSLSNAPLLVSRNLYYTFKEMGNDIIYLTYFQDGKEYSRFQKLFGFKAEDKANQIYRCGIFPLILYTIKYKPDIIHLINLQLFYIVLFPLKLFIKFKTVLTVHGVISYELEHFTELNKYQKKRLLLNEYLLMKFTDSIFTLSNLTARYIRIHYKVPQAKIKVVSNGIKMLNDFEKNYNKLNPVLKCLFIGNIDRKEKGFDFLLRVLLKVKRKYNISVFSKNNIDLSKYDEINIKILEPISNEILRKEIINYDLFITTSTYESFSLSLLEAMNEGLLFIASDRVGFTEKFDNKLLDLVYKHNNEKSFLERFDYINNLNISEKIILSNHIKKFASDYSLNNVCDEYLEKYLELCHCKN